MAFHKTRVTVSFEAVSSDKWALEGLGDVLLIAVTAALKTRPGVATNYLKVTTEPIAKLEETYDG